METAQDLTHQGAETPHDAANVAAQRKAVLEALLFVAGEAVPAASLAKSTDVSEKEVVQLILELAADYRQRGAGLVIRQIEDSFQIVTNPEFGQWVKRFRNVNVSTKLSQPALETLAIIAYKQPITRVEIDQLRGVNSDGAIKTLLEKRLIKIVGKKEVPGRPFLYATTKDFLQYFGLSSLSELPSIPDILRDEAA
ncbi:MAG: segregation and condensation protein B [Nitrospirae bacterium]|nr:MAG: segregation and condensation protein B [Nitrospirota bacterium]